MEKIVDKFIYGNKIFDPIWLIESKYELKNLLENCNKALRIIYDKNKKFYILSNINSYMHKELLIEGLGYGLYPEILNKEELEKKEYFFKETFQLISVPKENKEYIKLKEDGYNLRIDFSNFYLYIRATDIFKKDILKDELRITEALNIDFIKTFQNNIISTIIY